LPYCTKCGNEIPQAALYCPNCGSPIGQTVPSAFAPSTSSELDNLARDRYAQEHWVLRLLAFIIDYIAVVVAVTILEFLILLPFIGAGLAFARTSFIFLFVPTLGGLAGSIMLVLYFAFAEYLYGTTLGKKILHLRVVMVDGTRIDLGKAFIRNISKIYWLLLLLDIIVGLISHTKRGQKYSDYIASTNVIRESS
jgi:uncharacterized RDD family membrane protein YckC